MTFIYVDMFDKDKTKTLYDLPFYVKGMKVPFPHEHLKFFRILKILLLNQNFDFCQQVSSDKIRTRLTVCQKVNFLCQESSESL